MSQLEKYENLTRFRMPLIKEIIEAINIKKGSNGIDIGCGIGRTTQQLAQKAGNNGKVTGLDFSAELLGHASLSNKESNLSFIQGDINQLELEANAYDWIWSMDTVWAGPKEFGCPAEHPDAILEQFFKILKPGGTVNLLFWTSQKFLPGYPLLESRLNAVVSANAPYVKGMDPYTHNMNASEWLSNANFKDVKARSFTGNINGPLSENDKEALQSFFNMLWGNVENEIPLADWKLFDELSSADSENYILNKSNYCGYYTYTLFQGTK